MNVKENNSMGVLKRLINNISHDKSWKWLKKETLREKQNLS